LQIKLGKSVEAVTNARAAENPSGRFGTPSEFGAACAYLCSSHAGYITVKFTYRWWRISWNLLNS